MQPRNVVVSHRCFLFFLWVGSSSLFRLSFYRFYFLWFLPRSFCCFSRKKKKERHFFFFFNHLYNKADWSSVRTFHTVVETVVNAKKKKNKTHTQKKKTTASTTTTGKHHFLFSSFYYLYFSRLDYVLYLANESLHFRSSSFFFFFVFRFARAHFRYEVVCRCGYCPTSSATCAVRAE